VSVTALEASCASCHACGLLSRLPDVHAHGARCPRCGLWSRPLGTGEGALGRSPLRRMWPRDNPWPHRSYHIPSTGSAWLAADPVTIPVREMATLVTSSGTRVSGRSGACRLTTSLRESRASRPTHSAPSER